jgi:hypothetical protein
MGLMNKLSKICVPMGLMLVAAAGGCASGDSETRGRPAEEFLGVDEETAVTRLAMRQTVNGARTDATIRPYHFDDGALNSLGQEKLDFLVTSCENRAGELVVYVDVPVGEGEDDKKLSQARHDSVTEYLVDCGLTEESFRLETGHNPHNTHPAVLSKPGDTEGGDNDAMKAYGQGVGESLGKAMMDGGNK